jgi:hypothetical protein
LNGFLLRHDDQNDNVGIGHIIKDTYFPNSEPELWISEIAQFFDSTFTLFRRFVSQMDPDRLPDRGSPSSIQRVEILNRILSENDPIRHVGYYGLILARLQLILQLYWAANQRVAIVTVGAFFVVGLLLLQRVPAGGPTTA